MLFVGDDWAEDHHDIHLMDETGEQIARRRLPEVWVPEIHRRWSQARVVR